MSTSAPTMPGARERYLAEYRERAGRGGRGPQWLDRLRSEAAEHFAQVGFPSTRQEAWRFTNVAPVEALPFSLTHQHPSPQVARDHLGLFLPPGPGALFAVFVNGRFAPGLSSLAGLPSGVTLGSLGEVVRSDGGAVEAHLGRHARVELNPFTALATAFLDDGAFLHVRRGVEVEAPVQLVFLSAPGDGPSLSCPRTLVVAERDASVTVVETYVGLEDRAYLTAAVTELAVEDGARVTTCRIQRENDHAYHMATTRSHQGRDSVVASCAVAVGSVMSRHDLSAVMGGSGGHLTLNGLSILRGRQHVDHHTAIEHAEPHCDSRELFNGVLDDHARSVFTGRIIVRPGAQRTDSKQTNNNLLLSEDARADSQPQLEIYADDVKCTHGATLGPLDPAALFYMQSRAVGPAEARDLLTYGFSAEVIAAIEVPELRRQLDRLVRATLDRSARRPRTVP